MFVVVQFPIADMRAFTMATRPNFMGSPSWPPRTDLHPQFLRLFGCASDRRRGVDYAWIDESAFCRAHRALRFPQLPGANAFLDGSVWKREIRCAFRRILSDGQAVGRVEIGFSFMPQSVHAQMWRRWDSAVEHGEDPVELAGHDCTAYGTDPLEIVRYILGLPTCTPHLSGSALGNTVPRQLVNQGSPLAELFFRATTRGSESDRTSKTRDWPKHIAAASPVVLIECKDDAIRSLPNDFIKIDPQSANGVPLAFGRLPIAPGKIDVWLVGCTKSKAQTLRNIRICLLRLHAERQVLANVLNRLRSGEIPYLPDQANGERIESYLNDATRVIDRKAWADIRQSEILSALDAINTAAGKSTTPLLESQLNGMRFQIKRKVQRFEERFRGAVHVAPGGNFTRNEIVNNKTINIGPNSSIIGNVVIADDIQNSFNTLAQAKELDSNVKGLLDQLLKQVADTSTKVPEKDAKELGDNASGLTKEVTSEKPRRRWYEFSVDGLKQAAEAVGEVGKPILKTVAALVPLLVALFP